MIKLKKYSIILGNGFFSSFSASCLCVLVNPVFAQQPIVTEGITVTGGAEEVKTTPGSATWIDSEKLQKYEHTDIHKVLNDAPGVYVRDEEGFGLRPNIGMRGAPAERSQKINIMEDGVLIGPAPYSAPAAYYFPNVSRMHAVEVFKGPVAIPYGPNTVGGALNLVTAPIPDYFSGEVNAGYGSDAARRLHLNLGDTAQLGNDQNAPQLGWMVEGITIANDGFKTLPNGGDTGFERQDFDGKFSLSDAEDQHRLTMKIGIGNENSNETYLGLTDADFAADPYQRYAASQNDQMKWDHNKLHLDYQTELAANTAFTARLYQNNFDRSWRRFDGFRNNTEAATEAERIATSAVYTIDQILSNPDGLGESRYMDILSGEVDSSGDEQQKIDIVTNDRAYVSQGIEWILEPTFSSGDFAHQLKLGLRYHEDEVERFHSVQSFNMTDGTLQADGINRAPRLSNIGRSKAWSGFIQDEIQFRQWRYTLGLRAESIKTELVDRLDATRSNSGSQDILVPGAGVFYQYTDNLGFLAGVNRGYSPNAPAPESTDPGSEVKPETSVNWEFGVRYQIEDTSLDAILFFSDYTNLVGRCRTADAAASLCNDGEEINGGAVEVGGLELVAQHHWMLEHIIVPLKLVYTNTESAFQTSFDAGFSQWGSVSKGDELPYLPEHLLMLETGFESERWSTGIVLKYTGEMREVAGRGEPDESEAIDEQFTVDMAANYFFNDEIKFQFKVINMFDAVDLVSRRPFGARPNRPRSFELGVQYFFE